MNLQNNTFLRTLPLLTKRFCLNKAIEICCNLRGVCGVRTYFPSIKLLAFVSQEVKGHIVAVLQ